MKEKDANFTGADVRNGMTAIVSIKHPDPRFEGQTKTKLDNPDAARVMGRWEGTRSCCISTGTWRPDKK